MPERPRVFAPFVLLVAMVSAACGQATGSPALATPVSTSARPAPSSSTEPSVEPTIASVEPTRASVAPASPLEGTWATGVIEQSDVEATLQEQGLGDWVEKFRSQTPIRPGMKLVLVILGGHWNLYGESANGLREPIDFHAEYETDGASVTVIHADGTRKLGWNVFDDTLTIESMSTTLAATAGIPDEVFQVALYMTETFARQAD